MWRRVIALLLCAVMLSGTTAFAAETRGISSSPELTFDGATALCKFEYSSLGDTITVTMKLWQGDTLVESWTQTGTSEIIMSKTCEVSRLKTYTLEVSGTCGGVAFGPVSVSKRCPLFG